MGGASRSQEFRDILRWLVREAIETFEIRVCMKAEASIEFDSSIGFWLVAGGRWF